MNSTVLLLSDYTPRFKYAGFVRGINLKNITIRNMTLDGNQFKQYTDENTLYGRYGFYCETCDNVVLDTLRVTNWHGYGIDPHGAPSDYVYSNGLIIQNCISENNGWDGITIDKTKNTIIKNTVSRNNGRHGINIVTGSLNTTIVNNVISNNGYWYYKNTSGNGITIQNNGGFGTSFTYIYNNTIRNSSSANIYLNTVSNTTVVSNTISGTSSCMTINNTNGTILSNNICNNGKKIVFTGYNKN